MIWKLSFYAGNVLKFCQACLKSRIFIMERKHFFWHMLWHDGGEKEELITFQVLSFLARDIPSRFFPSILPPNFPFFRFSYLFAFSFLFRYSCCFPFTFVITVFSEGEKTCEVKSILIKLYQFRLPPNWSFHLRFLLSIFVRSMGETTTLSSFMIHNDNRNNYRRIYPCYKGVTRSFNGKLLNLRKRHLCSVYEHPLFILL